MKHCFSCLIYYIQVPILRKFEKKQSEEKSLIMAQKIAQTKLPFPLPISLPLTWERGGQTPAPHRIVCYSIPLGVLVHKYAILEYKRQIDCDGQNGRCPVLTKKGSSKTFDMWNTFVNHRLLFKLFTKLHFVFKIHSWFQSIIVAFSYKLQK